MYFPLQISVAEIPSLIWQTTTGVDPDPPPDPTGAQFRAGTVDDPVPIVVENTDATNPVWLGGSDVDDTGFPLAAGGSLTFNVVGNDSLYAISAGSVVVAILVGRQ